jgi:hypothetical protein
MGAVGATWVSFPKQSTSKLGGITICAQLEINQPSGLRKKTSKLQRTIYTYRIDPVETGLVNYNRLENR